MALKKQRTLPSSLSGEYWRIVNISFDIIDGSLSGRMVLYKDDISRASGSSPIDGVRLSFKFYKEETYSEEGDLVSKVPYDLDYFINTLNPMEEAYAKIKVSDQFFNDAEDI